MWQEVQHVSIRQVLGNVQIGIPWPPETELPEADWCPGWAGNDSLKLTSSQDRWWLHDPGEVWIALHACEGTGHGLSGTSQANLSVWRDVAPGSVLQCNQGRSSSAVVRVAVGGVHSNGSECLECYPEEAYRLADAELVRLRLRPSVWQPLGRLDLRWQAPGPNLRAPTTDDIAAKTNFSRNATNASSSGRFFVGQFGLQELLPFRVWEGGLVVTARVLARRQRLPFDVCPFKPHTLGIGAGLREAGHHSSPLVRRDDRVSPAAVAGLAPATVQVAQPAPWDEWWAVPRLEAPSLVGIPILPQFLPVGAHATHAQAGVFHTCAALANGKLRCWGSSNGYRLLGGEAYGMTVTGDNEPPSTAGDRPAPGHVVQLVVSILHSCLLELDGDARCWGRSENGNLGVSNGMQDALAAVLSINERLSPGGGLVIAQVATGAYHSCVLLSTDSVHCFGETQYGRLGVGCPWDAAVDVSTTSCGSFQNHGMPYSYSNPIDFGNGTVVAIATQNHHSCAEFADGSLACWGLGSSGRLGYGSTAAVGGTPDSVKLAGRVSVGGPVRQVAVGWEHTCVVLASQGIKCWGESSAGQLGYGNRNDIGDNELPSDVGTVSVGGPAVQVACGGQHSCAVLANGDVVCWGKADNGRLGYPGRTTIGWADLPSSAGPVLSNRPAVHVSAGYAHSCATLGSGQVRCWGSNSLGELGLGHADDQGLVYPPNAVADGGIAFTQSGVSYLTPRRRSVAAVSAGSVSDSGAWSSVCIVREDALVHCWGADSGKGHLGLADGVQYLDQRPVELVPIAIGPAKSVACGPDHHCALLYSGRVTCWGQNAYQMASSTSTSSPIAPTAWTNDIAFDHPVVAVAAGRTHTCVLLDSQAARCWGNNNYGQLGLESTSSSLTFSQAGARDIQVGGPVVSVRTLESGTCALLHSGKVRCWGKAGTSGLGLGEFNAKLGDDEPPSNLTTVSVGGEVAELYSSVSVACTILVTGEVRCWGLNWQGQLGVDGAGTSLGADAGDYPSNYPPLNLQRAAVRLGLANTAGCAVLLGGLLKCWGANPVGSGRIPLAAGTYAYGKIVLADSTPFIPVGGRVFDVVVSGSSVCVTLDTGGIKCSGIDSVSGYSLGRAVGIDDDLSDLPVLAVDRSVVSEAQEPLGPPLGYSSLAFVDPFEAGVPETSMTLDSDLLGPCSALPNALTDMLGQSSLTGIPFASMSVDRCFSKQNFRRAGKSVMCVADKPTAGALAVGIPWQPPAVRASSTLPLDSFGRSIVGLEGDFGWLAVSSGVAGVTLNGRECALPSFTSLTQLQCQAPAGIGTTASVKLHVSEAVIQALSLPAVLTAATDAVSLRYARPNASSVSPPAGLWAGGGESLAVMGSGFGEPGDHEVYAAHNPEAATACNGSTASVTIGGSLCRNVRVRTSFELSCVSPALVPGTHAVQVCIGGQVTTDPVTVTYQQMEVNAVQLSASTETTSLGNQVAVISGLGFGNGKEYIDSVTWNGQLLPAFNWTSPSRLQVLAPGGFGQVPVLVRASHGSNATAVGTFRYAAPVVLAVEPKTQLFGLAGITMTIVGRNFGFSLSDTSAAQIGGLACTPTSLADVDGGSGRQALSCLLSAPDEGVPTWPAATWASITAGGQLGSAEGLFTGIPPPDITSVTAPTRSTRGGDVITLRGVGFGRTAADVASLTVGGSPVSVDAGSAATNAVSFALPAGCGKQQAITLTLVSGRSSGTVLDYDPPVVVSVEPASLLIGMVGAAINVTGRNFGNAASDVESVMIGGIPCAVSELWRLTGEEQIVGCTLDEHAIQQWPSRGAQVQVCGQQSALAAASFVGVDEPSISQLDVASASTLGGDVVRVQGTGLGLRTADVAAVLVNGLPATDVSLASQKELSFRLPPGCGKEQAMALTLVSGRSSGTVLDYDPPVVVSVEPASLLIGMVGAAINVTGRNFGNAASDVESVMIGGIPCAVSELWRLAGKDQQLACVLGPHSGSAWPAGVSTIVEVRVCGQGSGQTDRLFRGVDAPAAGGSTVVAAQFPTAGGQARFLGDGLGRSAADIATVLVSGRPLDAGGSVVWKSQRELQLNLPPGTGQGQIVEVRLVSGHSAMASFSYNTPKPVSVLPDSLMIGVEDAHLSIVAADLGSSFESTSVLVGGLPCSPDWLSEPWDQGGLIALRRVNCTMRFANVTAWPRARSVTLVVDGQSSGAVEGLFAGMDAPAVTTMVASSFPTAGGATVRLIGDNLGRQRGDIVRVTVGGTPVNPANITWLASQEIRFVLPSGAGGLAGVQVELASGRSVELPLKFDKPELTAAQPSYLLAGAYHTEQVIVFGRDLAPTPTDVIDHIELGGVMCDEAVAIDAFTAVCRGLDARAGWPASASARIMIGGQWSDVATAVFEGVPAPEVASISPVVGDAGEALLLFGANFGRDAADISSVTVDGNPCLGIIHKGDQALECRLPEPDVALATAALTNPAVLRGLPVVVTNAHGVASVTNRDSMFTYTGANKDPPSQIPARLRVWRRQGEGSIVWVSWSFPDEVGEHEAPIESFQIRVAAAGVADGDVQLVSLRQQELATTAVALSDGSHLYETNFFALTIHPVVVDVRAISTAAGNWSVASEPVPERCAAAEFLNTALSLSQWQCQGCPVGAHCGGDAAENVSALAGFWRVPWSPAGLGFAECQVPTACLGYRSSANDTDSASPSGATEEGASASGQRRRVLSTPSASNATSSAEEGCGDGYFGTMCSSCQAGYTRWGTFSCRRCVAQWLIVVVILVLAVVVLAVVGFMVLNAFRAGLDAGSKGQRGGLTNDVLKIVFSHLQTVGIAASFSLQWPSSVEGLFATMAAASSATSEVLSLDCLLSGDDDGSDKEPVGLFFSRSAIVLAMPLLMLVAAAALWACVVPSFVRCCAGRKLDSGLAALANPRLAQMTTSTRRGHRPSTGPFQSAVHLSGMRLQGSRNPLHAASQPPGDGSQLDLHRGSLSPSSDKQRQGLKSILSLKAHGQGSGPLRLTLADKSLTSAVVILFLLHMSLTQTSFQLLTCADIVPASTVEAASGNSSALAVVPAARPALDAATGGGCGLEDTHRRLLADLEVCCHDPWALRRMYGLAIPGLLLYAFGIPIVAAWILCSRSSQLRELRTRVTLGFLYNGYRPSAYYWESVIMLRKVLVAAIAILLAPIGVALQTYVAVLLIFSLTVLHLSIQPFESVVLNRLELAALVTAFVTFECGLFLTAPETSGSVAVLATLAIFAVNLLFLVFAAWVGLGPLVTSRLSDRKTSRRSSSSPQFVRGSALGGEAAKPGLDWSGR